MQRLRRDSCLTGAANFNFLHRQYLHKDLFQFSVVFPDSNVCISCATSCHCQWYFVKAWKKHSNSFFATFVTICDSISCFLVLRFLRSTATSSNCVNLFIIFFVWLKRLYISNLLSIIKVLVIIFTWEVVNDFFICLPSPSAGVLDSHCHISETLSLLTRYEFPLKFFHF